MSERPVVRLIRPATEPLGLFLRPGHTDHRVLSQILSEGRTSMTGVVFDPSFIGPQEELRSEVRQRNLWAILDTRMMDSPRQADTPSVGQHFLGPDQHHIDLKT